MQKKTIFIIFFVLVLLGLPSQVFSQNKVDETLKGFDTLKVVVEQLNSETEQAGLKEEQIQTDIEIKLRQNGFNVKGKDDFFTPFIFLYVKVSSIHNSSGLVAYNIQTSLNQRILLERDKSIGTVAETWKTSETGTIGQNYVRNLRNSISDQVDKFINDWLKANASTQKQRDKSLDKILEESLPDLSKYEVKSPPKNKQDDSPFTAVYIGGNKPPEIEVFNDSNRTLYLDMGQGRMTAYTILSGTSQKINLSEGNYNFKASAPRVRNLEGQEVFKKGYIYTWRFTIITVSR